MKARLALKVGILFIAAVGFLSGCFLVKNSTTIGFLNFDNTTYDCFVEGDYATTVGPYTTAYYEYSWSGGSTTTVYIEVTDYGLWSGDTYVNLEDGIDAPVTINLNTLD